ncbi:MAG TPA: hypothetical protein VIW64_16865 [Pyrinomonadaceae bacterium]|jgi:hypothetical protein
MFKEFSSHSMQLDALGVYDLSTVQKPTIKILLYTDAPELVVKEPVGSFGLGRMISQLEGHAPAFANLSVKWAGRYSPGSNHADKKINVVLATELEETKEPFDQIWFFGIHQVNKAELELGLGGGGPESELDADEVNALRDWMDQGGGVLVTGDHANLRPLDALTPDPNSHCPDKSKEPFLSLGRALGRCIPRAGLLRDWEGSPTSSEEDSNNTQVVTFGLPSGKFDDEIIFQRDRIPQQLILQAFDEKGSPSLRGRPHPLFFYKRSLSIQLFPDHLHEGQVTLPEELDDKVWLSNADGFQPKPRVVAYGLDKRAGKKFQLLVAYDGDSAGVGRIVADSTWHHYLNVNLSEFKLPANEGSASDQIGQFYGNLAVWLSPAKKRSEMADAMFRWLVNEPLVVEGLGPAFTGSESDKLWSGKIARSLLAPLASPCEIHELLQIAIPETYRYFDPSGTIFLPEREQALSNLPSKELMLGYIINKYPRQPIEQFGPTFLKARGERIRKVFDIGCDETFEQHYQNVIQTAELAKQFLAEARLKSSNLSNENKHDK